MVKLSLEKVVKQRGAIQGPAVVLLGANNSGIIVSPSKVENFLVGCDMPFKSQLVDSKSSKRVQAEG